jgi:hypothetical protein
MARLWPGKNNTTVSLDDRSRQRIESRIRGTDSRAEWFRNAGEMRIQLAEAAESAGMADELDDDWWRDWLYDAAREELRERRERELADEQEHEEIEATD